MINWTEHLVDPTALKSLYGEDTPLLKGVNLHGIEIQRDGPKVLLRFDLREFPNHPPTKWKTAGFNRIQLRLLAVGVRQLQISGIQSNCMLDLNITKENGIIRLNADNGALKLEITAEHVMIDGVSAYCDV
ncbi:hypothetical protein CR512_02650 [Pseudomonas putida]|nr:hypothetical protein CR512_02650 [Pseudomonas putida]